MVEKLPVRFGADDFRDKLNELIDEVERLRIMVLKIIKEEKLCQ